MMLERASLATHGKDSEMKSTVTTLVVFAAAAGCGMSEESEVAGSSDTAEAPYYGCWETSGYSANTTDNLDWKSVSKNGPYGGRTGSVRERDDHPYSVLARSTYTGAQGSTDFRVRLTCINNLSFDTYHVWSNWFGGTDNKEPGCGMHDGALDQVYFANSQVRVATCN
jgi:hypothetical protein